MRGRWVRQLDVGNVGPTPDFPSDARWQPAGSEIAAGDSLAVPTDASEGSAAPIQRPAAEDECNMKECTGSRRRDARQGLAVLLKLKRSTQMHIYL